MKSSSPFQSSSLPKWAAVFCFQGMLAVISGAFAAHALEGVLSLKALSWWNAGNQYLMYHSFVGLVVSLTLSGLPRVRAILVLFIFGNLFFTGSLYFMALTGVRFLGAITPIGGTLYILGWGLLALQLWKLNRFPTSPNGMKK